MRLIDKNSLNFTNFEIVMCDGDFAKAFKLICEKLDDAPIIEAEPIKHGYWAGKPLAGYAAVRCSVCNTVYLYNSGKWNYCPNCGALMDLEANK